jgi:phenylpyruvate tautomerase PptA (4-oxalocrotonate tautomerase family)
VPVYTCTTNTETLTNGWARRGHPEEETTRLALEIARTASRVTGAPETGVLVVIQSSPARAAAEGGRVLPEPGQEAAWIAPQSGWTREPLSDTTSPTHWLLRVAANRPRSLARCSVRASSSP